MKKIIFAFALLMAFTQIAFAQMTAKGITKVNVMESQENMSLGKNNAMVVTLEGVDDKDVGDIWEDYLKDYYGVKTDWERRQKEWFSDDANIPAIGGATPLDIHAAANERGDKVEFTVWFNLGNDFLNSRDYTEQYAEAEKLMEDFIIEVRKVRVKKELEEQEKELKDLEEDLERLESKNDRYHEDIEKAEEAIEEARRDIAENEKEQEVMRQRIETQKEMVEKVRKKLKKIN